MTNTYLVMDPMNGSPVGLEWFTPVKYARPIDPIDEGSI